MESNPPTVTPLDHAGIALAGAWTMAHFASLPEWPEGTVERVDASGISALDSSGAWVLLGKLHGARLEGLPERFAGLLDLVSHLECHCPPKPPREAAWHVLLEHLGALAVYAWQQTLSLLSFGGQITLAFLRMIRHPRRWRVASLTRHIEQTGIDAIPIIALISFLISIVLAYQGATQLRQFGAQIYTVNLVAVSVLREMGVLLTAIMVAGRSGSAFTAELGVMQVNEEVDAIRTLGLDPVEVLVLPRMAALLITLPLLTFVSDVVGLLGGGVTSFFLLDISWTQYFARVKDSVQISTFWVGMVKAPVFAFLIGVVGCRRGLGVKRSAVSLGEQTTLSVVESIFLVMLADALFSIIFSKLGL